MALERQGTQTWLIPTPRNPPLCAFNQQLEARSSSAATGHKDISQGPLPHPGDSNIHELVCLYAKPTHGLLVTPFLSVFLHGD